MTDKSKSVKLPSVSLFVANYLLHVCEHEIEYWSENETPSGSMKSKEWQDFKVSIEKNIEVAK